MSTPQPAVPMSDALYEALSRQEALSEALASVVDLLCGDGIDRSGAGRLATLLYFLQTEYQRACEAVRAAVKAPPV